MLLRGRQPLGSGVERPPVHRDIAVAPRLPADPIEAIVTIVGVGKEHVAGEVASGLLTDIGVSGGQECQGVFFDARDVSPFQHHWKGPGCVRQVYVRGETPAVPHGYRDGALDDLALRRKAPGGLIQGQSRLEAP